MANFEKYKMMQKTWKINWNPGEWVLIWEFSAIAIQWIPTWQGLNGFQKCLHPCALGKRILSIGRVKFGLSKISESICPVMMYVFTHLSWCPIGVVTDQGEEPPPHLYHTVWGSVCLVMMCVFTSLESRHPAVWYPIGGMVGQGGTLPIHHIPIEGWGLGRRYVWSYGSPYCG